MAETQADKRAKLLKTIEQAKARIEALDARESTRRRKAETRGAIVFSGYAVKAMPELLDRAIADLEGKTKTPRESLDLAALNAFKVRGQSE